MLMVVEAIRLMITWRLISGLARQLMRMKPNIRYSILFHLQVPGGKRQTSPRTRGSRGKSRERTHVVGSRSWTLLRMRKPSLV